MMQITQSIVQYEANGVDSHCGLTIIPAGKTRFVVLTDFNNPPLSETIYTAATEVYRQFLMELEPRQIEYYVYRPKNKASEEESMHRVAMAWDRLLEVYVMPKWHQSSMEEFMKILYSYEYVADDIPPMSFNME